MSAVVIEERGVGGRDPGWGGEAAFSRQSARTITVRFVDGESVLTDAVAAYQNCVVQRMQIAVEDGRQLSQDARRITRAITAPVSNGLPKGET